MFFTNKDLGIERWAFSLRKDPVDSRDYSFSSTAQVPMTKSGYVSAMPNRVDMTAEMSPVKSQGQLGSCVGFAVSAMKEWQEQKEHAAEVAAGKKNHRDEKYYDLSESWIYWNSKKIDPWPHSEGTSIRCAFKVLNKIGVPTEKAWPYDDAVYGEPKRWAPMVARWSLIASYERVNNLDELKIALMTAPVVIGIGCFEEIMTVNRTGFVPYPKNPAVSYGGHAICAVGYDDRTGRIKFKNSWGSGWGHSGYGYLPYDYIKDFMWDAWSSKDLSVTKEMLKGASEVLEK